CRGSDYLYRRMYESMLVYPHCYTPSGLMNLTEEELARIVSDDGQPESTTLDRLEERVRLSRDLGKVLSKVYENDTEVLFPKTPLSTEECLLRLSRFEAYSDPLHKKSYLLLLHVLHTGEIELQDPERIQLPVDYHVMR